MQDTRNIRQGMREGRRAWGKAVKQAKFTGEKPSMLLYLGVSMIALFKDLLDLVGIGSLPAIGTVITICFTFLIWMLFLVLDKFDKSGGGSKTNRAIVRGLILIFVGLVEGFFFGLNLLPIETATIIVLYFMARHAYKKAEKEHKDKAEEEAKKNPSPSYA